MITERPDIDLNLLSPHFTECGNYTKEAILEELEYWRSHTDFLVLVSENDGVIDGFIIGYRDGDSLWLSQIWHRGDFGTAKRALEYTKDWARRKGLKDIKGETKRNEMKAMSRWGFGEFSVNMRLEL